MLTDQEKEELKKKIDYIISDAPIEFAEVHPTNQCNLFCKGCTYKERKDNKVLPFDAIKHLSQLKPSTILIVGGGEPTLYKYKDKNFNDLVVEINQLLPDAEINLTTNGIIVPDVNLQKMISFVGISLHGSSQKSYEDNTRNRDPNLFKKIIDNIFNEYYIGGPIEDIRTSFVYSEDNLCEIPDLIAILWDRWKVASKQKPEKKFRFILQPFADDTSPNDPYALSKISKYGQDIYRKKLEQIKEKNPGLGAFIEEHAMQVENKPFIEPEVTKAQECWMVCDYVLLAANGFFYPCCVMAASEPDINLGHYTEGIYELRCKRQQLFSNIPLRCKEGCRIENTLMGKLVKKRVKAKLAN